MKSSDALNIIKDKDFPITSVCRADLEGIGFDTTDVDDGKMLDLASKMANAYCDMGFWEDLEIIAEYLKIKKHENYSKTIRKGTIKP